MNSLPIGALIGIFIGLLILSAFFSSSETGMMSLNRYRLKHLSKNKHKGAQRAEELLSRPDRLIGVILIGNNLVNFIAASVATLIALRFVSEETATWLTPVVLTFVVLIFAEVTPKTLAALKPERIAFPASWILKPLLKILSPAVVAVNAISNALVKLLGVNPSIDHTSEHLRPEELRTVVDEAGDLIPDQHQGMLLNVLDLEKASVDDIMIPRNEVIGLDLENSVPELLHQLRTTDYTRLPVYEGDINNVLGILHLRNASRFLHGNDEEITHEAFKRFAGEPYFVPEGTPLSTQLLNFKHAKRRMALVVDEYGEVQGLVTLEDLLEEIVGDFTTNSAEDEQDEIRADGDDWYLIDCSATIRDINKALDWSLPTEGPKTLNGLAVEYLETLPTIGTSFKMDSYLFEITEMTNTRIEKARVKAM